MKVLFVCTGNTCRSPMAEGYLKSLGFYCESRGLAADGSPVSKNSAAVMQEMGIDISKHISKQLTAEDVKSFDTIICMSNSHCDYLKALGIKCEVLGSGISDPYGCDINVYRNCRDEIIRALYERFGRVTVMEDSHLDAVVNIENTCFSHPWTKDGIIEAMQNRTHFFVFEKDECIMGYVGITVVLDEGYITNIATLPEYRGQGVASALLTKLNDFAKLKGLCFISLEVRKSNQAAISLYERFGYKTEGIRKNFYDAPREDALIMTKRF
ncbi:MAG: ribosomal-protein-alanine N-acetyltransferase [Ruminococcaceae bacterium]|nr:ribosomal-protein-alanine N-acetyltransferase [Oscillospiraceae bacterium]